MKVGIDISVFTKEAGAFGNVHGALDFEVLPMIGDNISFMFPINVAELPSCAGHTFLKVEGRIHSLMSGAKLLLSLSDLKIDTIADALAIAKYFEKGSGLYVDIYDESLW